VDKEFNRQVSKSFFYLIITSLSSIYPCPKCKK